MFGLGELYPFGFQKRKNQFQRLILVSALCVQAIKAPLQIEAHLQKREDQGRSSSFRPNFLAKRIALAAYLVVKASGSRAMSSLYAHTTGSHGAKALLVKS